MLKGLNTYEDLMKVYNQMGDNERFKHKKTGVLFKRFWVAYNNESEIPGKTEIHYSIDEEKNIKVKIKNLHKHFEIVSLDSGE